MIRTNTKVWWAVLAVLALTLAACAPAAEEAPEAGPLGAWVIAPGDPIKIAAHQAISGAVASLGTDQVRGVEIAIDDWGGEIHGHPITLQVEDDQCNAEGGTTGAQRIVADDDIIGVIGTSCSGAAVPAVEIISQANKVMISGSNTSPSLTSDLAGTPGGAWQPGYYRTAHNDIIQGAAAATFAFEELGVTRAASIHDGDPYTEGLVAVFNRVFEELGGDLVLATAVNKGDTDMRPVLTEIVASGAEVVYFPIFQPEGDFIAVQSKEIPGMEDVVLFGADGLLSDTYVVIPETAGMYFSGPAPPEPEGGAYEDFVAKYREKYGEAPIQAFHGHAYDAASMLLHAIEEVGVEQGDGSLFIDRQQLRDFLNGLSNFQGLTGTLTCDDFGDCADPRIQVFFNEDASSIEAVRANVVYSYGG